MTETSWVIDRKDKQLPKSIILRKLELSEMMPALQLGEIDVTPPLGDVGSSENTDTLRVLTKYMAGLECSMDPAAEIEISANKLVSLLSDIENKLFCTLSDLPLIFPSRITDIVWVDFAPMKDYYQR